MGGLEAEGVRGLLSEGKPTVIGLMTSRKSIGKIVIFINRGRNILNVIMFLKCLHPVVSPFLIRV